MLAIEKATGSPVTISARPVMSHRLPPDARPIVLRIHSGPHRLATRIDRRRVKALGLDLDEVSYAKARDMLRRMRAGVAGQEVRHG